MAGCLLLLLHGDHIHTLLLQQAPSQLCCWNWSRVSCAGDTKVKCVEMMGNILFLMLQMAWIDVRVVVMQ